MKRGKSIFIIIIFLLLIVSLVVFQFIRGYIYYRIYLNDFVDRNMESLYTQLDIIKTTIKRISSKETISSNEIIILRDGFKTYLMKKYDLEKLAKATFSKVKNNSKAFYKKDIDDSLMKYLDDLMLISMENSEDEHILNKEDKYSLNVIYNYATECIKIYNSKIQKGESFKYNEGVWVEIITRFYSIDYIKLQENTIFKEE